MKKAILILNTGINCTFEKPGLKATAKDGIILRSL
jgi:hypothetical protein